MPVAQISDVFIRRDPIAQGPVLFETPRSGRTYPGDFRSLAALDDLLKSVSLFVEDCYADVPDMGATWLFAPAPNTYIDLNRHELDIDPDQIADGSIPDLEPSAMCKRGSGLIPTVCARTKPLYDKKLTIAEIEHRIAHYYRPYHAEVARILDGFRDQWGAAFHLSCHSMPDIVPTGPDAGSRRSDFDLGDRNGTTCHPALTQAVAEFLRARGYSVTLNTYFVGAEAVRKHGDPKTGIHSLQIEMNRKLYMDEEQRVPIERLATVRSDMAQLAKYLVETGIETIK